MGLGLGVEGILRLAEVVGLVYIPRRGASWSSFGMWGYMVY